MNYYTDTFDTSFGAFSVAVTDSGALAATAFGTRTALLKRLGQRQLIADATHTRRAREQITAYLSGERRNFDLEIAAEGSAFQHAVWTALRRIPFGETRSYGDLARELKSAPRAVGRANATNPICLVVPCHRVIGADGSLTGFAFGEDIKRRLLEHEGALVPA